MWGCISHYSVLNFHLIRSVLWYREETKGNGVLPNGKLVRLPFYVVKQAMEFAQYDNIYKSVICMLKDDYMGRHLFSEIIEIDENTTTGIKVLYTNDPVNCLHILRERDKREWYCVLWDNAIRYGYVRCLEYMYEKKCDMRFNTHGFKANIYDYYYKALKHGHVNCMIFFRRYMSIEP